MKKSLKRFERLENTTLYMDLVPDMEFKLSKRFMKLEVNDKKIELVIEDKISREETISDGKKYFFLCPYCGNQNDSNLETCGYCKHRLKNQYIPDYNGKTAQLKKCHCGALNLKERRNCWVCGRDFSLWGEEAVKESPENIITLNIDGKVYKSTDADLPSGIVALMEKIRREGYNEEIVQKWVQERNLTIDQEQGQLDSRLAGIQWGLFWRIIGLIAVVIYSIFQFRAIFNSATH
ncbi:MAG: zinc ribbon domain-containing protein [Candidatus Omnitrophota bacterium]